MNMHNQKIVPPEENSKKETLSLRNRISVSSIKIQHFKKIDDEVLNLEKPVTFLIGSNRSGKSSFLQASMMMIAAAQQFQGKDRKKFEVSCLEQNLRYSPTHDFEKIGHKRPLENFKKGYSAKITFSLNVNVDGSANTKKYGVAFRKSRGESNISMTRDHDTESNETRIIQEHSEQFTKDKERLVAFSVYVPGIAGIVKKEVKLQKIEVYRSMFGDAGSVLRNVLLLMNDKTSTDRKKSADIETLERDLSRIIGDIKFHIAYDNMRDHMIHIDIENADHRFPLELCSLGELQLIQIIAYWIFLKPKLLLLDEPDSHLHPDTQAKLVNYLTDKSRQEHTKVIVATHSPQIILAVNTTDSSIFLVENGKLKPADIDKASCLMAVGALDAYDKNIFIWSEDNNTKYLEAILNQWQETKDNYKVLPFGGIKSLPHAVKSYAALKSIIPQATFVILIDRDYLTDTEVGFLSKKENIPKEVLFATKGNDIEWYFTDTTHLKNKKISNIDHSDVCKQELFNRARGGATARINDFGNIKPHEEVWDELTEHERCRGKDLLEKIIKHNKNSQKQISEDILQCDGDVATDLKEFILASQVVNDGIENTVIRRA